MDRMGRLSRRLIAWWVGLGPRVLPFADVATPDLPLPRLLRLSLFQVSVGMTMVLLVGTLNRVMIVELDVPASMVGLMIALPLVFAPFRALIGFNSDHHRSVLGWRRVPFIWKGSLAQFSGFAIMPLALLVLAGKGESAGWPVWVGQGSAALAFLLVGAGMHTVQTTGLALATDLTPSASHPKVVGLMYVTLLLGMIGSAMTYGALLADFSHARLIQVIQGTAVVVLALNGLAMWKQEVRRPRRGQTEPAPDPTFRESWAAFAKGDHTTRRLVIIGLGTLGFGLADVLLEPFGGQILHLSVGDTTQLTALFAVGGLSGFATASHLLNRGGDAYRVSGLGVLLGVPGFVLVLSASSLGLVGPFLLGNFLIGFGGALFGHGTLTVTMNRAPKDQVGLALGAWGSVQATAAGVAMASSGVLRDLVDALAGGGRIAVGYNAVYAIEIALLVGTLWLLLPLWGRATVSPSEARAVEGGAEPALGASARDAG
jgi:BCD family chlorophyll transporter-like MFS transporter